MRKDQTPSSTENSKEKVVDKQDLQHFVERGDNTISSKDDYLNFLSHFRSHKSSYASSIYIDKE
jgi:hypothetical protein